MTFPKTKPIPETHHDILVDRPTAHLATIRPDGRLSVNPVALMWDGEHVRVSTLKSRKKYRNLKLDPRVAISIPHRKDITRYVEIRGIAELTDDTDRSFVNSMARHYMGVDEYPFDKPGDERVTITIHAEQVSVSELPRPKDSPSAPGSESRDDGS